MKLIAVAFVVCFWFLFGTCGWSQWRLERLDEVHELRADRTLPGVFNAGSGLNGRWLTTEQSERRSRPGQESFFKAEGFSIFWEHMDFGYGRGAPTAFGVEMSGKKGLAEMEFFFGEFLETESLGVETGGVKRAFVHNPKLFSFQGYTFLVVNETGRDLKGLRMDLDLLYQGEADARDLPKLELQISKDDATYETFGSWMPSAPDESWKTASFQAEVAEEIPAGGTVYVRVFTGIGTGPHYARLGWTRIELTPLGETPVQAGPRTLSLVPAARSLAEENAEKEADPKPAEETEKVVEAAKFSEPVGGAALVPAAAPEAPKVSPETQTTAAVVKKENGRLLWVVIGLGVVGVSLLGGCSYGLWRIAQSRVQPDESMMG